MQRLFLMLVLGPVLFGLSIFTSQGMAASDMTNEKAPRKAILLVAFGTSVPEAAKAFDEIEKTVRGKYVGIEIRWAYTSRTIRGRYAALGKAVDSPETALSRLMDEGFNRVAVLSLHIVPGQEFNDLQHNALLYGNMIGGFEKILVARPLLGNNEDMERVAGVLAQKYATKAPGEGVIFIGHGNTRHPSDAIYLTMDSLMNARAGNLFVGTVESKPSPDELIPKLAAGKIRKVRLVPLMTVAGDHARKDMAGDGPESWQTALAKKGIESAPIFDGLAQSPEIVRIWLDHLDEILSKL